MKKSGKTRRKQLNWETLEKRMLGPALNRFYTQLMTLEGKDFTSEYLKGMQYFKPMMSRDLFIGDIPPLNLKDMTKEELLALRDAKSEAERNKIIKKHWRERDKTAD